VRVDATNVFSSLRAPYSIICERACVQVCAVNLHMHSHTGRLGVPRLSSYINVVLSVVICGLSGFFFFFFFNVMFIPANTANRFCESNDSREKHRRAQQVLLSSAVTNTS